MRWLLTLVIIPDLPPQPKPIPCFLGDDAQSAVGEVLVLVRLCHGDHWSFPTYFTPGKCSECCWAVTNGPIDYHLTNSSSFSVWQMFDNCTVATLLPSPLHQTLYSGWGTESQNSLELEGAHKDDWIQLFSEWPIQGLNLQPCCYLYHSLTIWANLRVTWK